MAGNVYTVKQVNAYIKNMFMQDYMLNRIYVKGEVSNCKYHTSGHIYFSLKDESGTLACVMFAGQRGGLSFRMSEGQQIVVLGTVNVYERSGSYQLYAKEIRLDGEGILYEKFQILKKELEEKRPARMKERPKKDCKQPPAPGRRRGRYDYVPGTRYEEKKSYANVILIAIVVLILLYLLYK